VEFTWPAEMLSPTVLEYWYKSCRDFFDRYASNYEDRDYPFAQVAQGQPGDGADPGAGVGEHGTIAQDHDVTEIERAREFARLLDV
jgi:hypothetical protein